MKPESDTCFNEWNRIAHSNQVKLDQVFNTAPRNGIDDYVQLKNYKDNNRSLAYKSFTQNGMIFEKTDEEDRADKAKSKEILNQVEGVLVEYPLEFLKNEWFP